MVAMMTATQGVKLQAKAETEAGFSLDMVSGLANMGAGIAGQATDNPAISQMTNTLTGMTTDLANG